MSFLKKLFGKDNNEGQSEKNFSEPVSSPITPPVPEPEPEPEPIVSPAPESEPEEPQAPIEPEEPVSVPLGQGQGVGAGNFPIGRQPNGSGAGPEGECVCPSCGAKAPHQTGTPCSEQKCPQCGTTMARV